MIHSVVFPDGGARKTNLRPSGMRPSLEGVSRGPDGSAATGNHTESGNPEPGRCISRFRSTGIAVVDRSVQASCHGAEFPACPAMALLPHLPLSSLEGQRPVLSPGRRRLAWVRDFSCPGSGLRESARRVISGAGSGCGHSVPTESATTHPSAYAVSTGLSWPGGTAFSCPCRRPGRAVAVAPGRSKSLWPGARFGG